MRSATLKVVPIGNSRGIRLPAPLLARYRIKNHVAIEQRSEGILLTAVEDDRLSWEETARAMAAAPREQFAEVEKATVADGLAALDQ